VTRTDRSTAVQPPVDPHVTPLRGWVAVLPDVVRRWRAAAPDDETRRSTPTVLRALRVVTALVLAVAGLVGVLAANTRSSATEEIATRIEALNADATTVYRSLADADATVTSGFLASGLEPAVDNRDRYDADIAATAASLARADNQATDEATAERIANIGTQLPVYTGLIEQARANNRQGLPVGASYLRRASELMQTSMLPTAEALQQRQAQRLDETYQRAGSVPVGALTVALLALAGLLLTQVWLAFQFRRVLTLGTVVATVALLLGLLWWTVAGMVSGGYLDRSQTHSEAISEGLGPSQVAALQARATESLALVARDGGSSEQDFDDRMQVLARDDGAGGALGASGQKVSDPQGRAGVQAAVAEVIAYREAHDRVRTADSEGDYADAVRLAVSADPGSAATAFGRLDAALAATVRHERASFNAEIARARDWRTGLVPGTGLLALVAIVGALVGLGQRLEEYR